MAIIFFFFKQKTAYEIGVRLVGSEMCIRDRENHGDLPGNGDLRFLHADSLRELHSPGLKRGPFLRPIKQNGRRFEQVASEKPVAPSRYLAIGVSFSRLVAPRCKAQI